MQSQITIDELRKIPYANADALGDRKFLLMPLWDGETWHQWVQDGKGGLLKIQIVDLILSNYVSKALREAQSILGEFSSQDYNPSFERY